MNLDNLPLPMPPSLCGGVPILGQKGEVTLGSAELPAPRFKTLIVAANPAAAEQMQRELVDVAYMAEIETKSVRAGNPDYYVAYVGEAIMGRRFKGLLIGDRVMNFIRNEPTGRALDWYNEVALTRLIPGAHAQVLS